MCEVGFHRSAHARNDADRLPSGAQLSRVLCSLPPLPSLLLQGSLSLLSSILLLLLQRRLLTSFCKLCSSRSGTPSLLPRPHKKACKSRAPECKTKSDTQPDLQRRRSVSRRRGDRRG